MRENQNIFISTHPLGATKTCELSILIAIERKLNYLYDSINYFCQNTANNASFSDYYLHH